MKRSDIETVKDIIIQADTETQIELYNYYRDVTLTYDQDVIRSMDDFDEEFSGMTPTYIAANLTDGFNINHDWYFVDVYGHIHSTDRPYIDVIQYTLDEIAYMIVTDHTDLNCSYIRENMLHEGLWDRETAAD